MSKSIQLIFVPNCTLAVNLVKLPQQFVRHHFHKLFVVHDHAHTHGWTGWTQNAFCQ